MQKSLLETQVNDEKNSFSRKKQKRKQMQDQSALCVRTSVHTSPLHLVHLQRVNQVPESFDASEYFGLCGLYEN